MNHNLSDIEKLTTFRCTQAIWNFKVGFEYWDLHAADVLALYKGLLLERDSPQFFYNIENALEKYDHWSRFHKCTTLWIKECQRLTMEQLHPGLRHDSAAIFAELKWLTSALEVAYPFPLKSHEFKPAEYPAIVKETAWLMENVMVNACDGDIDTLQDVSINIGSTIIQLAGLTAAKYIRRDQARKVLELMLEPTRIGVDLNDVLHLPEFEFLNEEVVDDAMTALIDHVIAANEKAVKEYKSGKEKALGAVLGQVMKQVKADPRAVREAVLARINQ